MRSGLRALSEIARFDEEADVVVVGLGCAGAAGAIEAARAGARTLVLERASGGGGTSALSGGVLYLGGGTKLQRACGFEDTPEDMFAYLMASVGDSPDEAKTRLSALIADVERLGERVTICRYGKPVAELVPVSPARRTQTDPELRDVQVKGDLTEPTEAEWEGA